MLTLTATRMRQRIYIYAHAHTVFSFVQPEIKVVFPIVFLYRLKEKRGKIQK